LSDVAFGDKRTRTFTSEALLKVRHSGAMRSIEPGTQGQPHRRSPLGSGSRFARPE